MANKVASKRWIYSNFSVGSSSNECATKTEILGFGLYITNDSSYASNQLVREEDIYLPAWTYSFSVSNWDKNVGESGGTTSSIMETSATSETITTLVPTVTKVIDVIIPNGVSIINQQILDELPTSLPVKGHCAYSVFDVRITPTPAP